ncbi:MAG: hypothetical protein HW380_322 [Magnetococcales bacterium]|nr:hypothetical protein [Magnetococcales bacterium]
MSFCFFNRTLWVCCLALLFFLGGCATFEDASWNLENSREPALEISPNQAKSITTLPDGRFTEPPTWRLGSFWQYSDGYGLQVTEADGRSATLKRMDRPQDWIKRDGFFTVDSVSNGVRRQVIYRSPNPDQLFPLAVGKNISFVREYLIDNKLHVHKTSWNVVGRETIEVPAGKFDCWVMVWNTRSEKSNWSGYEKWWYSPAVGNYVRLEYRYAKAPDSSRVLVRYNNGSQP